MAIIGEMEIRLRADIARLQRDMDGARRVVGDATAGISRAADMAKVALASIGLGAGMSQIIQMADAYAKFTAQLKLATLSAREYGIAMADVKRIATTAQQDLGSTGVLYAKIANGTRELGIAQKQVAAITEVVNLSLKVSGATANEASSAQLQLSQAFASGTLRGEEFNAVNEAAPRLMLALADGIGVPVGALKQMATEGKITSAIMADVLPQALGKLREEAKSIETIGGALTVLKSNLMEMVGMQANASGAVAALTGTIGALANNLALVSGSIATLLAAKIGAWAAAWVADIYTNIAANRVLLTSNLATANSQVVAAGAASTLAAARVIELRAAVASASGAVALAITTNGLIPAQARATIAAEAHAAALVAQTTAMGAASVAGGVLRGALAFLGGPVGLIITALGLAATAWAVWGKSSEDANKKALDSTVATGAEILASLEKQNQKLRERVALAKAGNVDAAKAGGANTEKLASTLKEINDIRAKGSAITSVEKITLIELQGTYDGISNALKTNKELTGEIAAIGEKSKSSEWMLKYATNAEKLAVELALAKKEMGAAFSPEIEERIRAQYNAKDAGAKQTAAAAKKEVSAYASLITTIGEKIAANNLELSGYDKLSESQKLTIKLDEEIKSGKSKLSKESIDATRLKLTELAAQEESISINKRVIEQAEETAKIQAEYADRIGKSVESAIKEADAAEELVRAFGLSKSAIDALTLARMEENLVKMRGIDGADDNVAALEREIAAMERRVAAGAQLEGLEASKKANDDMAADWKKSVEQYDDVFRKGFAGMINGGKGAWKSFTTSLVTTFKTSVADQIYRLFAQPFVVKMVASMLGVVGGGASGVASAMGGEGDGASALSMLSTAKSAYSAITSGFADLSASVTGYTQSAINSFNGTNYAMAGAENGAFASGAGTVAGYAGGVAAGIYGGRMISGGYSAIGSGSGNTAVNVGTAIGAFFGPLGAAVGGMLGGLVNRAFGMKAKEISSFGVEGNFDSTGFAGNTFTNWHQDGGWLRSDKNGRETGAFDSEMTKLWTQGFSAVKSETADFAASLGLSADTISGYSKRINITLTKDDAKNKELIAGMFVGMGEDLAKSLLTGVQASTGIVDSAYYLAQNPDVANNSYYKSLGAAGAQKHYDDWGSKEGRMASAPGAIGPDYSYVLRDQETYSAALQRLSVSLSAVNGMLDTLDSSLLDASVAGGVAASALVDLFGGLDAMKAVSAGYFQAYYSEQEKVDIATRQLGKTFSDLGYAMPASNAALRSQIEAQDLTTEAGRKAYAQMMGLSGAFASLTTSAEQLTASTQAAAQAAQEAAQAAAQAAAQSALADADAAFGVLQRVADREKSKITEAHEVTMKRMQKQIDTETASIAKHKSLSDAIGATLDQMRTSALGDGARADAQAQVRAALAITRAGGPLPAADSLKDALSILARDSSGMFATMGDYLRDQYRTQNDIADLGSIADISLSIEEQTLQALTDQKDASQIAYDAEIKHLFDIVTGAQLQLDEMKGQSTTLLSIDQALQSFLGSMLAAQRNPIVSATPAITSAYQSALGRNPEAAGLQHWQDQAARGTSTADIVNSINASSEAQIVGMYRSILGREPDAAGLDSWEDAVSRGASMASVRQGFLDSDEYKRLNGIPGFAGGGDHMGGLRWVGELGPEVEATGASRIHSTRDLMANLRNPASNNDELVAELREQRKENAELRKMLEAHLYAIAKNTLDTADFLDGAVNGETPILTATA